MRNRKVSQNERTSLRYYNNNWLHYLNVYIPTLYLYYFDFHITGECEGSFACVCGGAHVSQELKWQPG